MGVWDCSKNNTEANGSTGLCAIVGGERGGGEEGRTGRGGGGGEAPIFLESGIVKEKLGCPFSDPPLKVNNFWWVKWKPPLNAKRPKS